MQTQTSNTLYNAIMEAGSKDRPPMLAPGNYVQWKSRIKRYIDTKPNHELIHYCLTNPPYVLGWKDKPVLDSEGSPTTKTKRVFETYKNVTEYIRDQLNAEAEAVQIILTGIDNDIYSTVDACPNACEMMVNHWNRITQEWQRFVTLVKQSQELKTVSYHKLYDILKQHQHEVNEIRAKKIACFANPLALVAQQQPDNSLRINRNAGYENQRNGTVAGARETVGSSVVQKSGIQCYNCKEFRHAARECQKPKRAKDAAYHREKMLLSKQEEAGIQLNAEQADWRNDTDDDELEVQKVSTDDHYNVFAMESVHPEQSKSVHDTYPIEQDAQHVIFDSLDMSNDRE
uniref:CCHC-type domain-containing protein n=1 Tax=Tanacetum cinerariifolium TaxID=118510 RepID=A0A699HZT7_TANCI|nr:hypothetical protein [Tanacetum cinerariifolium]